MSASRCTYLRQTARRLDFAASSQTRSARAHIARGIAAALLDELGEAKRLGRVAVLELRRALEISAVRALTGRALAIEGEPQT